MTIRPFLHLPPPTTFSSLADISIYLRRVYESLFQMRRGKLECVAELTLTPNADSSDFSFKGLSPQSVIIFDPKTANAAAELYGGTMYVLTANRGNDVWTVTHANNAQADRAFQVAVIG